MFSFRLLLFKTQYATMTILQKTQTDETFIKYKHAASLSILEQ